MGIWQRDSEMEKLTYSEETSRTALSTTNPVWTDLKADMTLQQEAGD
jgi:hypothetical protein